MIELDRSWIYCNSIMVQQRNIMTVFHLKFKNIRAHYTDFERLQFIMIKRRRYVGSMPKNDMKLAENLEGEVLL